MKRRRKMNMQFVTKAEIRESQKNHKACGYQFDTSENALAYLAKASLTWRNPEWAAADLAEQRETDITALTPLGEN